MKFKMFNCSNVETVLKKGCTIVDIFVFKTGRLHKQFFGDHWYSDGS